MIRYLEGGMSPAQFAELTDAQIWSIYFRKRTEDGKLVRYGEKPKGDAGSPISDEELGIPDGAFEVGIQQDFVRTFWTVERRLRRCTPEQTLEKWHQYLNREAENRRGKIATDNNEGVKNPARGRHPRRAGTERRA